MPLRASLGTNVVLRLLLADQAELHERALRLFATPDTIFEISDIALIETVFALERHYELSRGQIAEMIASLAALHNVDCNAGALEAAAELWRNHPKLSFEDCLMAERAAQSGAIPLWTFDRKLATQHHAAREVAAL